MNKTSQLFKIVKIVKQVWHQNTRWKSGCNLLPKQSMYSKEGLQKDGVGLNTKLQWFINKTYDFSVKTDNNMAE